MAEILVKAIDFSHPDPVKDALCYKRGHPVIVMEDGHAWGTEEKLPKFVILKMPGVPVSTVAHFIDTHSTVANDNSGKPVKTTHARRKWRVDVPSLPAAARTKLGSTGVLVIASKDYKGVHDYTWAQLKTFVKDLNGNSATDDI